MAWLSCIPRLGKFMCLSVHAIAPKTHLVSVKETKLILTVRTMAMLVSPPPDPPLFISLVNVYNIKLK